MTSCRDKRFQLEERNTIVIFQRVIMVATCAAFGCTNSRKNSPGLIFHRIPAANAENKLLRQRYIQNIHRADPLPKDETFYVCANHFKKYCFHRDLKVCNFVSAYLTCILLVYKILESVHQQSFLPPWIPKNSISYVPQSVDKQSFVCNLHFGSRVLSTSTPA